MLRVTTLYASSAAATAEYYTKYLVDAPGEAPGVWAGDQAAALGLAGTVTGETLESLLCGFDPTDRAPAQRPTVLAQQSTTPYETTRRASPARSPAREPICTTPRTAHW